MVLENCVRYIEVSAIKRSTPIENLQLVPKYGVSYREVSAIKHVRYREVPLYLTSRLCITVNIEGILCFFKEQKLDKVILMTLSNRNCGRSVPKIVQEMAKRGVDKKPRE